MDRKTKEYIAVCPDHCDAGLMVTFLKTEK